MKRLTTLVSATMRPIKSGYRPYLIAVLAIAAVVLLRRLFLDEQIGPQLPLLLFILPVIAAAWSGGWKPGFFAVVLGAGVATYFYIEHNAFRIPQPIDQIRLGMFILVGGLLSGFMESLHAARRHLEDQRQRLERQQQLLAMEIHRREEARFALQEREERIRLAVESANIGTFDFNPMTGERNWSTRTKVMFGLSADADVSKVSFLDRVHPEDRERVEHALQKALDPRGHGVYDIECRVVSPDGSVRWFIAKGQAMFEGEGSNRRPVRFIGTVVEITERKRIEKALRDADRRKDEFLATLAHELRNPLTPISNALHLWPQVENDQEEMENLRTIMERQVQQMSRLIDDLMDVSRITQGKIELRKQRVDVCALLNGAIEAIQPYVESCGHQMTVILPTEPVFVDGDVARLMQVFGNMLNNAAKYTGRNGVIWVSARMQEDKVVVSIRDNGPGIPQRMLSEIFEMFRQVDGTISWSHGGLGIGLTLVKQLVELHGGTVEARSDGPGKGSEFIVILPALASKSDDQQIGRPRHQLRQINALPRRKILVVDDVQASAKTLAMMLRAMGQDVSVVHDGPAAIEWVLSNNPNVVFLDIAMPEIDGYQVARRLRENETTTNTVLIALTGYGQEEDRRQAFQAGFNHHMVKPPSIEALENVLQTVLPHNQRQSVTAGPP